MASHLDLVKEKMRKNPKEDRKPTRDEHREMLNLAWRTLTRAGSIRKPGYHNPNDEKKPYKPSHNGSGKGGGSYSGAARTDSRDRLKKEFMRGN